MTAQSVALAAAPAQGRFDAAHKALLSDRRIQFDLPTFVAPRPPAWLEPFGRFLGWLAPAVPYIFWGIVGLTLLCLAYFVISNLDSFAWMRRPRSASSEKDADEWRPEESAARALLAEAEALAAQGRYAEAARLLLARSVEDIARRLPQFMKPSLTARDIAASSALPGAARPAFGAIAHVVEVSAFGSRTVTADAWAECRSAYAKFAMPGSWTRG